MVLNRHCKIGIISICGVISILLLFCPRWGFVCGVGLVIFSVSYAVLCFKEPVIAFLKQKSDNRDLALAAGLSAAICGTAWLVYIFGGQLAAMASVNNSKIEASSDWLSNIDYLSAAAAIIAACISLIPIFWLIGQNKRIDKQLKLQRSQNNADVFARACELAEKGLKSYKPKNHDEALILLRAAIPLLREAIIQDKTYSWTGVKTLMTIYKTLNSRHKIEKKGMTLRINILRAFGEVAERISNKDDEYDSDAVDELKSCIEKFKEILPSLFSNKSERILNILNKKFPEP